MRYLIFVLSLVLILLLGVSDALAASSTNKNSLATSETHFSDSVFKIKEDDEGKLIVLNKAKPVLFLKYGSPKYDFKLLLLSSSQKSKTTIQITTDSNLNVLKVTK